MSFVFMGAMAIGGLLMRRSFVSQEELKPISTRLQTIEQTYAKDREVAALKLQVEKMEEAIRNLPDRALIAKTQEQLARVEERCKHLDETIVRIERPLQLIIEAKINRRSTD
ncbi:MAG: DUF2730 family protein [Alishewanella aestuarii]